MRIHWDLDHEAPSASVGTEAVAKGAVTAGAPDALQPPPRFLECRVQPHTWALATRPTWLFPDPRFSGVPSASGDSPTTLKLGGLAQTGLLSSGLWGVGRQHPRTLSPREESSEARFPGPSRPWRRCPGQVSTQRPPKQSQSHWAQQTRLYYL